MIKASLKKFIKKDNIIYIVFIIYLIAVHLDNTVLRYNNFIKYLDKYIRYICYVFFTIKIIIDLKKEKKISWIMIIGIIISLLTLLCSKNTGLLLLILILFALKDANHDKIIKITFYTNVIMFVCIIGVSVIGILPDWTYSRIDATIRHSMGYYYPTIISTYFFFIVIMRLYIKKDKISIIELLFQTMCTIFLYKLTDSRTGMLLTIIVIISALVIKILKKIDKKIYLNNIIKKNIKYLCVSLPIILMLLIILMIILFNNNNSFVLKVNDALSGRIFYASEAIKNNNITLFGEKIKWFGWGGYGYIEIENFEYNFVDIAFIKILFDYGIVTLVALIITYSYTLNKAINEKKYYNVYVLVLILIWALIEPNILEMDKNIFILFLSNIFNTKFIKNFKYSSLTRKQ